MIVIATNKSSLSDSIFDVLLKWNSFGLIEEFVWVTDSSDGIEGTLVRGGEITQGSISFLLVGMKGQPLHLYWLTAAVHGGDNSSFSSVQIANKTLQEIHEGINYEYIVKPVRIIALDEVETAATIPDRSWQNIVFWVPEDRRSPLEFSGILPQFFPAHVASGIATLCALWSSQNAENALEIKNLLFDRSENSEISFPVLARAFTRILILPEIRSALLSKLNVDSDEVPRPGTRSFDRVDLDPFTKKLADAFIAMHPTISRFDILDYLVDEEEDEIKYGLDIFIEIVRFIKSMLSPKSVVDAITGRAYSKVTSFFEDVLKVPFMTYEEAKSSADGSGNSILDFLSSDTQDFIEDGDVRTLWSNFSLSVFSLLDGSDFNSQNIPSMNAWNNSLPPHDRSHPIVSLTRSSIVGPRSLTSDNLNSDVEVIKSSYVAFLSDSLNNQISIIDEELLDASKALDIVDIEIDPIQSNIEQVTPLSFYKKLWKKIKPDKTIYKSKESIRSTFKQGLKRAIGRSSLFAIISSILLFVLGKYLGGITAIAGFSISILCFFVSIIIFIFTILRVLFAEASAAIYAKDQFDREQRIKAAVKNNLITKVRILSSDKRRLIRRQDELTQWTEIINRFVHSPWKSNPNNWSCQVPDNWPRPLSVELGIGEVDEIKKDALSAQFERHLFSQGWLSNRFENLKQSFTRESEDVLGSGNEFEFVSIEDPSVDPDAPRVLFSRYLARVLSSDEPDIDLMNKVRSFIDGITPVDNMLSKVTVPQRTHDHGTGDGEIIPQASSESTSAELFFSPLENLGEFIEFELKSQRNQTSVKVDVKHSVKFPMTSSGQKREVFFPTENELWNAPFVIENVLQFLEPIATTKIRSFTDAEGGEVISIVNLSQESENSSSIAENVEQGIEINVPNAAVTPSDAYLDLHQNENIVKNIKSIAAPEISGQGMLFSVGNLLSQDGDTAVSFWPGNTALSQLNVGIVGDLGTGKTQLLKMLILKLRRESLKSQNSNIPILIFDYKKDFQDEEFLKAVGGRIANPRNTSMPLNILLVPDITDTSARVIRARALVDIVNKIFPNIGSKQSDRLTEVIVNLYEKLGHSPTLDDALTAYKEETGTSDGVVAALNPFSMYKVFSSDTSSHVSFEDFLGNGVTVIDLSYLSTDQDMKNFIVALFLNEYLGFMMNREKIPPVGDEPKIRFISSYLLIDEAFNIMDYHFQALDSILRMGREFGIGVMLSSQFLSDFDDPQDSYSEKLHTWFIHRVPDISLKELQSLGIPFSNQDDVNNIKTLKNHESYFSSLNYEGVFMKDIPFFQIMSEQNDLADSSE